MTSYVSILHAPTHGEIGASIARLLAEKGYDLAYDDYNYDVVELTAMDAATVIIWSPTIANDDKAMDKARRAMAHGSLIPVCVDRYRSPGEFADLKPIDLSGWSGIHEDPRWRFLLDEVELCQQRLALDDFDAWSKPSPPSALDTGTDAPHAEQATVNGLTSMQKNSDVNAQADAMGDLVDDLLEEMPANTSLGAWQFSATRPVRHALVASIFAFFTVSAGVAYHIGSTHRPTLPTTDKPIIAEATAGAVQPSGATKDAPPSQGQIAFVRPLRPVEVKTLAINTTTQASAKGATGSAERAEALENKAIVSATDQIPAGSLQSAVEQTGQLTDAIIEVATAPLEDTAINNAEPKDEPATADSVATLIAQVTTDGQASPVTSGLSDPLQAGASAALSTDIIPGPTAPGIEEAPDRVLDILSQVTAEAQAPLPEASPWAEIDQRAVWAFSAAFEAAPAGVYSRDCLACPDMAAISAGSFSFGSTAAENGHKVTEGPVQQVQLAKPFAMAIRETTFDQWQACVDDGGCQSYQPADVGWGRKSRPVINVSFEDAQAYAQWLSSKTGHQYRLPTEAEWEYAARAGSASAFSFGDRLSVRRANYDARYPYSGAKSEPHERTLPTGAFEPNVYGLFDMHGNVAEWTADCWTQSHTYVRSNGAPISADCSKRVIKGGAWSSGGWRLRAAYRADIEPSRRDTDIGFRVVREHQ